MHFSGAVLAALPLAANAANLVLSNDDGWAEKNIRTFYSALTAAGENVVLSGPAENQSGSGSRSATPTSRTQPCQFNSCPANSPAIGSDPNNARFNYVNAFPVDAVRNGINIAPRILGARPDLVVTGPNVGSNLGVVTLFSGTVGAATEASTQGFPAIAFSGASGDPISFTAPTPVYARVYADLATNVTQTLLRSSTPLLPRLTYLNVNFPESSSTRCGNPNQFRFILTRINGAVPLITPPDVQTCGGTRLPTESSVVGRSDGCFVSVSLGGNNKQDTSAANQAVVLRKLAPILSCLPN
ncbi:survival protein sure-like phosphatase/nucleotidase [Elsinoe ampelina]|uniref:Survival protein sure-like phosphatase/nucleotidase n=1 Tax=Elsinoe ampelina TaxID=302913 RepID=A0A6A6GR23_9PEZI|nr:survival protein sure-like phosphatase/nucleotidase [Elsinoe ampelina]